MRERQGEHAQTCEGVDTYGDRGGDGGSHRPDHVPRGERRGSLVLLQHLGGCPQLLRQGEVPLLRRRAGLRRRDARTRRVDQRVRGLLARLAQQPDRQRQQLRERGERLRAAQQVRQPRSPRLPLRHPCVARRAPGAPADPAEDRDEGRLRGQHRPRTHPVGRPADGETRRRAAAPRRRRGLPSRPRLGRPGGRLARPFGARGQVRRRTHSRHRRGEQPPRLALDGPRVRHPPP